MASDHELLDRWAGGDKEAGDALFRRHFHAIFRFFFNRSEASAEDLTQATFLGAVGARERFRGDASFRTYLFAIARNQLLLHFRKVRADERLTFRTVSMAALDPSPASALANVQDQTMLLQALRQLPADLHNAVELHYFEGLSTKEVGVVLDAPQGTVKRWLWRARQLLSERLAPLGAGANLERMLDRSGAG